MGKFFVALIAILALAFAAVTFAAPSAKKRKPSSTAFQVASVETAQLSMASVPLMTGYDVIQNISAVPRVSNAQGVDVAATANRKLSATVDWPPVYLNNTRCDKAQPAIVWRA